MPLSVQRIAEAVGAKVLGDASRIIDGVAPLDKAGPSQISFLANPKYAKTVATSHAGAIILAEDVPGLSCSRIILKNPYLGWARVCELFAPDRSPYLPRDIHPTAVIHKSASLGHSVHVGPNAIIGAGTRVGDNVTLHAGVVIEENCRIGANTEIHPNAVIHNGVTIGCRCIIWSGAIIGAYGFGYAQDGEKFVRIHQLGSVQLEDDVDVGANTTIDRGAAGDTIVRQGSKIDNLVMLAHNCVIGANTAIAAQCGLSGSTTIGDRVKVGGQVGFNGHLHVGNDSFLGAQAGITRSLPEKSVVTGSPARELHEQKKIEASVAFLPDLLKKFRALEEKVARLEKEQNPLA